MADVPSDAQILTCYATKYGFSDEYNHLVKVHERSVYDPLELLMQAQEMHRQIAKEQSIDSIVEQDLNAKENVIDAITEHAPRQTTKHKLKLFAKGTLYAAKNLHLHYAFVGARPGHIQEEYAEKEGDDPRRYVIANSFAEFGIAATVFMYADSTPMVLGLVAFTTVASAIRMGHAKAYYPSEEQGDILGSPIVGAIYWPIKITKDVYNFLAEKIRSGYATAREEEQLNTGKALGANTAKSRVDIEEEEEEDELYEPENYRTEESERET